MSKTIVKTNSTSASAATGNNAICITSAPSTNRIKLLELLVKGLNMAKGNAQVYLAHPKAKEWKKIALKNEAVNSAIESNQLLIHSEKSLPTEGINHVFVLPLSYGKTEKDYSSLIRVLSARQEKDFDLFALGQNKGKSGFGSQIFGFFANAWARIIHGIEASNIASGVIGFKAESYKELIVKHKITNPLNLMKLGYEDGMKLKAIEGNFGDLNYGFGAGFGAIYSSKLTVFSTLLQRFISQPLTSIKSDGIQIEKGNSPFYKLAFFAFSVIFLLWMAFTATDFNVTWDEPGHLSYSEDIGSYITSLGDDTTVFISKTVDGSKGYDDNFLWYGASVDTIAEGIHAITGGNIFHVRRYLQGFFSFLMLLVISLLAKTLFGWRGALLALLAAFFSPSFYGHFFNNHKDIPFALGYVMTAYYLILLLKELPKPKFQTMFMLALGVGFSLSIRASGLAQFGFVFAFMGLHWLFQKEKGKLFLSYILKLSGILAFAYILGIALWPYALKDPIGGPLSAFKEFSNFKSLHYMELFDGIRIKDKPWYYEPKLIMLTSPLMLLAGWILFILTGLLKLDKTKKWALAVLVVMTFAPSAYAIYKGSYLYNGWRHFLFIYPTLIVLAVWGFEQLLVLLKNVKIAQLMAPALAIVLLIPAASAHIKNHPYQYMYFNELAGGTAGAHGNYDLDYWNQTPKAAFAWLVNHDPKVKTGEVSVATNNIKETLVGQNEGGDSLWYQWCRELQWHNKIYDYGIFTTRTLSKNQILNGNWPPKNTIHEIKVDGVTVAVVTKKENNYAGEAFKALRAGKIAEAQDLYQKAYDYNPKEEENVRGLASVYKAKRSWDTALKYYKEAAELRDRNYEAHYAMGEIYLNKASIANPQNPDPALIAKSKENFEKTIEYKSNFNTAYYYLGTLALAEKQDYKAIDFYKEALLYNPNMGAAYVGIGKAFSNVRSIDSAITYFNYAIQINQFQKINNPEPYYYLAQLFQQKGDQKTAQQYMQAYQQMIGGAQ